MASITPAHDQATDSLPKYRDRQNMVRETLLLDDVEVQTNSCYQITGNTQVGKNMKQSDSNTKEYVTTSDLQMYANPSYQYSRRNIYHNNENCNDIYKETGGITSNSLQYQAKANNESENDDKLDTNIDVDSIRKCLYIMVTLTVILLSTTMVAIVLSVLTYTQLPKPTHQTQSSRPLTRIRNETDLLNNQTTEIQVGVSQALMHLNSTKNIIMALQIKLDETKRNVSQILFQIEETSRRIRNISELKIEERPTTQAQETGTITTNTNNQDILTTQAETLQVQLHCGAGEWHRVAHLNMSDPTESCPSTWVEYTSDGIRACTRATSPGGSCSGTVYPLNNHLYSKVCGRVIGYQFGSPDAFSRGAGTTVQFTIDEAYVDGISITHGSPRNHIWSYAAGSNEVQQSGTDCSPNTCPCSSGSDLPSYVGNNYYCESAYQGNNCYVVNTFFPKDPLWDGQQCDNEGTCCTGANTPPWFSMDLGVPTRDDIEVRICHNQRSSDEDSPVQLIELYVQ